MLDDAVEEKDGGEKVRIGMVVCRNLHDKNISQTGTDRCLGYSWQLGRHAGGAGEDRRRSPGPRMSMRQGCWDNMQFATEERRERYQRFALDLHIRWGWTVTHWAEA